MEHRAFPKHRVFIVFTLLVTYGDDNSECLRVKRRSQ